MPNNVKKYQKQIEKTRYKPFAAAKHKVGGYLELPAGEHWITGLRVYEKTVIVCNPGAIIRNDGTGPTIISEDTTTQVRIYGGFWTGNGALYRHNDLDAGKSLSESLFDGLIVHTYSGFDLVSAHRCKFRDIDAATVAHVYRFDRSQQSNANIIEDGNIQACNTAAVIIQHGYQNRISCRIESLSKSEAPAILLGKQTYQTKIHDAYFEDLKRPHAIAGEGQAVVMDCYAARTATTGKTVDLDSWESVRNKQFR